MTENSLKASANLVADFIPVALLSMKEDNFDATYFRYHRKHLDIPGKTNGARARSNAGVEPLIYLTDNLRECTHARRLSGNDQN